MVLGEQDWYMQKNETRPPTYIIHNNKFQMAKRLTNVSREIIKMVEENISNKISDIS